MKIYLAGQNGWGHLVQNAILGGEEGVRLYLAGGIAGNMNWAWKQAVKKPTVTLETLEDVVLKEVEKGKAGKNMRLYLAGSAPWRSEGIYDSIIKDYHPYILESFYYVDADTERLLPLFGDFMLDSGAFTFLHDNTSYTNWEEYIERYAKFIVKNNITKFYELDIDAVVGYEKVKEYRKRLEDLTGRQSIPVWHLNRGKEEFIKMCEEYSYVAIGGIAGQKKGSEVYKKYKACFPWFINTAHKNKAKIHALGYTSLEGITKHPFDSVDSTAWTTGNRFGYIYKFDGKTMQKIETPHGKKLGNPRQVALINYIEWLKFQKYAEENL